MRVVVFFILSRLSVAAPTPGPCKKLEGSAYQYKYEAETKSGIVGTSANTVGIDMTATVWLIMSKSKDFAQIVVENAKMTPTSPSPHTTRSFRELSAYRVAFKLDNGRIVEIYPAVQEPEEILNIKRGIISAFQVTLAYSDGTRTVQETDILGTCETNVTEYRLSDNTFTILKNRDTDSCSKCGVFTILRPIEHQEATFVDGSSTAQYNVSSDGIIQSASITQTEKVTPLSADAGKVLTVIQQRLKLVGKPLIYGSRVVCATRVSKLNFICTNTCHPRAEEGCQPDAENLIELMAHSLPHDIPRLFIDLIEILKKCRKRELEELGDYYIQSKKVDAESFREAQNASKIMKKHTFFLDCLAYVGTEPALDLIAELAVCESCNPVVNMSRKGELTLSLAFLPIHTTCPCLVLKRTLYIARGRPTHMIPKLVVGSVINKALKLQDDVCPLLISEAVKFLTKNLKESLDRLPPDFDLQADDSQYAPFMYNRAPRQFYDDAVHTIKSLGNAGHPNSFRSLRSAIKDKRLQIEGRAAAVYALQSMSTRKPVKVRGLTLEIFLNAKEEQEIRTAAFLTFMKTLTGYSSVPFLDVLKLVYAIRIEPDSCMKSFACTYMMAVERSKDPSIRNLRVVVYYFLKVSGLFLVCLTADKGYSSSKATRGYVSLADANLPVPLPRDVMGMGFSLGVVSNEDGWLPVSASGKVTANLFGYDMEMLEVGVRGTGIQNLFTHLFGPTGFLFMGSRYTGASGLPIHNMQIDKTEKISLSAYLKVLGQEIGWKQWQEDTVLRRLYDDDTLTNLRETVAGITLGQFDFDDTFDLVNSLVPFLHKLWHGKLVPYIRGAWTSRWYEGWGTHLGRLWTGKFPVWHDKFNITKTVRIMDVKRIIPTIIGMPLNLAAKAVGHLQLDAKWEIFYSTLTMSERVLKYFFSSAKSPTDNIHALTEISPKFSLLSSVNLTVNAHHFEPKLAFVANVTSNFTQEIDACLYDIYNLRVTLLGLPDTETWLLNSSYTQFAEVDGFHFTLGIDQYNETMLYEPVGSGLVNITLYSNISYPNTTGIYQAPLFPLSGPASLVLSLEKDNKYLEIIEFRLYNKTLVSLDKGQFEIELDPVGSQAGMKGYARWTTQPTRKVVEVDLSSYPGNVSSVFYGNTEKRMEIKGSVSLITDVSSTSAFFKFNPTHFFGRVRRVRRSREPWDMTDALLKEPIVVIPEFDMVVDGSLANSTHGYTSVTCLIEGRDKPYWLNVNYTILGLMVNISATSSLFQRASLFFVLPYPLKSPTCHVFDGSVTHLITFDGQSQKYRLSPACEYVLVRHRHINDAFAVTRKDDDVMVYINGTKYTMTRKHTMFKVDEYFVHLPYKQEHVIQVRSVDKYGHQYIRLSAWAGVDIYYSDGDIHMAVNGFYIKQTTGLCGNANYKEEDDLMLPNTMKFADTEEQMASAWTLSCNELATSIAKPTPKPTTDCGHWTCSSILSFLDQFSFRNAHFHVGMAGFYHACLYDVSSCHSPLPSIRAYMRAAHIKDINVAECLYGNWGEWSTCTDDGVSNLQYRERAIARSRYGGLCEEQLESRICERKSVDSECAFADYVTTIVGYRFCRSRYHVLQCATECEATYAVEKITMKCLRRDEIPFRRFGNVSPVSLPHSKHVVSCKKRQ